MPSLRFPPASGGSAFFGFRAGGATDLRAGGATDLRAGGATDLRAAGGGTDLRGAGATDLRAAVFARDFIERLDHSVVHPNDRGCPLSLCLQFSMTPARYAKTRIRSAQPAQERAVSTRLEPAECQSFPAGSSNRGGRERQRQKRDAGGDFHLASDLAGR